MDLYWTVIMAVGLYDTFQVTLSDMLGMNIHVYNLYVEASSSFE